jgi:RNA polymerase sigma factor (sigma-70 family)
VPVLVHLVDDDAPFRRAMGRMLHAAGYEVANYESAQQLLDRLPDESGPACILLDVRLPGLSGPELQTQLSERGLGLPIIFLTGYGDIPTSVRAIKAGADDFLTKPIARAKLVTAIEQAIRHYHEAHGQKEQINLLRSLVGKLTPRERQVFERVVRGKMNKQIAHELGTAERTIKAHRRRVMEKLQVKSLAELVSAAGRLGITAAPMHTNQAAEWARLG